MRLIFMGTPDFAVPTLDGLVAAGHQLACVYSQPPRRAGRGKQLSPSPVQRRALELGLELRTPQTLRDPAVQQSFAALGADAAIVAAYGLLLPSEILAAPRIGCLNVHASLLPRWRGAAPIQRAILAGDSRTGITIMTMESGLDTGPVRATIECLIERKTAGELTDELAHLGATLMTSVLSDLPAYPSREQPDEGVTYAPKIDKADARLGFHAGAAAVERQIRAFNPAPGAFFEYENERIRVHRAEIEPVPGTAGQVLDDRLLIGCGADALRPTLVQRAGRAVMTTQELLRGCPIPPGARLS